MRYSSKARAKVSDRYFFLSPDTRTIHCIMFQCCAYTPLLFSFSYCRRSYVISRAGNANVKTLQPRRGFDVFQETVNRDGLYIGCMKWLGISRGILTNHRSRNRRLCVDRIVQTRTAYAYRDRVFPNVLSEIYLLLEKKRIRFARICGKGKLLFGRNAEKACFPRIDGRSGRQVRRIENVNSNRSEPLGSSFLDGVPLYPSQCRSKSYTRSCCWW